MNRLEQAEAPSRIAAGTEKKKWLNDLLDESQSPKRRLLQIAASLVNGAYRRYSPANAPLRDLIALLRMPRGPSRQEPAKK